MDTSLKYEGKIIKVDEQILKECKSCGEYFDINQYNPKEITNKNGDIRIKSDPRCLTCRKIRGKEYYSKNRERIIEHTLNHHRKNRDKRLEYQKKWREDNHEYKLAEGVKYYWENVDKLRSDSNKRRAENKEYYNQKQRERKEIYRLLPDDYPNRNFDEIFTEFNNRCSLSDEMEDVTIDHFIPVSWGHGGTYQGNLTIIKLELNQSKRNLNPFKWVKRNDISEKVDLELFSRLVEKLAAYNNLSVYEFEEFVNWCENNKRSVEDLRKCNKNSLSLWREIKNLEVM
jgi:hypothetical protein